MVFYYGDLVREEYLMRKLVSSFMILGTFFMLSACGKEPSYKPVAINPEVDVCDLCNMSLVEENDVTELFSKDGDVYKFDDIGCMFEFVHKDKGIAEKDIAKQYVRDMESGKWIEVEKHTSPMTHPFQLLCLMVFFLLKKKKRQMIILNERIKEKYWIIKN